MTQEPLNDIEIQVVISTVSSYYHYSIIDIVIDQIDHKIIFRLSREQDAQVIQDAIDKLLAKRSITPYKIYFK